MIEFRHVMDMERRILILRKKFSYLFLISFLGILTALPISADYVDQAEAPLSPEFLEWQRINKDSQKLIAFFGKNYCRNCYCT